MRNDDYLKYEEKLRETEEWLKSTWGKILKTSNVQSSDKFFLLGGDSLSAMEFIANAAKRYGRRVPEFNLVEDRLDKIAQILANEKPLQNILERILRIFSN